MSLKKLACTFFIVVLTFSMFAVFVPQPQIKLVHATEIFSDGFESNGFSAWTGTYGSPSVVSTQAHSGTYSAYKNITAAGNYNSYKTISEQTVLNATLWFRIGTLPTDGTSVILITFSAGAGSSTYYGQLHVKNVVGTYYLIIYSTVSGTNEQAEIALTADAWHSVTLLETIDASAGEIYGFFDGVGVVNATGLNIGSTGAVCVLAGTRWTAYNTELWWDDVVLTDSYTISEGTPMSLSVDDPWNATYRYIQDGIPVNMTLSGQDSATYNVKNSTGEWVYVENQTYTTATTINSSSTYTDSTYTLYGWATNATTTLEDTIEFTVEAGTRYSVLAASGYWSDIQDAIDDVYANGTNGVGDVHIPRGTYNFTNVDEWRGVSYGSVVFCNASIRIYGSPYEVDANDMVSRYGTRLEVPYNNELATGGSWFGMQGTGDRNTGYGGWQNNPTPNDPDLEPRISGIWFVGWRYIASPANDTAMTKTAIQINELMNYRIDHCNFTDVTKGGVSIGFFAPNDAGDYSIHCNGVIDHCTFLNDGDCHLGAGGSTTGETVDYGVGIGRTHANYWDSDLTNIFGQSTNYTTFIEDCNFTKWRHCVASIDGAHVVFRYNNVYDDLSFGSVDQHGTYNEVGTRAIEMYNNTFTDSAGGWGDIANKIRGGAGLFYNNTVDSSFNTFIYASYDGTSPNSALTGYMPDCPVYVINNTVAGGVTLISNLSYYPLVVDSNLFYGLPDNYVAFTYPHPLVSEAEITYYYLTVSSETGGSTIPATGEHAYLADNYATVTAYPSESYAFSNWTLNAGYGGTDNPTSILMSANQTLVANFELQTEPFYLTIVAATGGSCNLSVGEHSYNSGEYAVVLASAEAGYSFTSWILDAGYGGTDNPTSILMYANHTLTPTLTFYSGWGGGGGVTWGAWGNNWWVVLGLFVVVALWLKKHGIANENIARIVTVIIEDGLLRIIPIWILNRWIAFYFIFPLSAILDVAAHLIGNRDEKLKDRIKSALFYNLFWYLIFYTVSNLTQNVYVGFIAGILTHVTIDYIIYMRKLHLNCLDD